MSPERSDPRPIQQILRQHTSMAGATLARAEQIAGINRSLRDWRDAPWIRDVRIANLRGDTVVVYATSAAALVPLRGLAPSLLTWLQTRYQIACTRIETKVRPAPQRTHGRVYRPPPPERKPSG
ncbi:hypothetical protein [Sinimarinibacterium thermocellulolyticum]|uniref:DUF721 domain-containing protein n=1 Tax=Sinimarinibacterium thermocellulolyticum TaxID=3170016 RepID=A0ABV2A9D9_9GAMM